MFYNNIIINFQTKFKVFQIVFELSNTTAQLILMEPKSATFLIIPINCIIHPPEINLQRLSTYILANLG